MAGEPLAHVTGWVGFRHLTLRSDRRALIPRPETEGLVELVLARVPGGRVADVGTGGGCIALSLASEGRYDEVVAIDLSPEALSLAEHRDIGAAGLFEICGLERLVELGLRHCVNLVDDALAELARRPTLRVLDVAGCTQLSRAGFAHLARITTLCELGLAYAPSVNDETVELLTSLKELVVLSVAYCPALTSAGLAKLAALPALKQVDVRQTLGFGPSEVGSLRARRPELEVIDS